MSVGAQVNGFGEGVAAPPAARRTIPFDYVFRFDGEANELKGTAGPGAQQHRRYQHRGGVHGRLNRLRRRAESDSDHLWSCRLRATARAINFHHDSRRACWIALREAR